MPAAALGVNGYLTGVDWNKFNTAADFPMTVGAFSASGQANGASISGTVITFGPATGSVPGMVTTGTQSMAGAKTFSTSVTSPLIIGSTSVTSPIFQTTDANVAESGQVRLGVSQAVSWRNNADSGDLPLSINGSNQLLFNGNLILVAGGAALPPSGGGTGVTNNDLSTITISGSFPLTLTLSASTNVTLPTTGTLATLAGSETLTNKTMSGSSNTFSNIGYSSLVLTGSIVNADVSGSAAIAYSKLNLVGSIVNADVSASAAIAVNKLAALTASRAVVSDGSGFISAAATTATQIGYLSAATGTTGTTSTNLVFSTGPTLTGVRLAAGSVSNVALGFSDSLGMYSAGGAIYFTGNGADNALQVTSGSAAILFYAGTTRLTTNATGMAFTGDITGSTSITASSFVASTTMNSPIFSSTGSNVSTTGIFRLSNSEVIGWRNAANDGNLTAGYNSSNVFALSGGFSVAGASTFSALTATTVPYLDGSKVLTSSAVTPTQLGYLDIAAGRTGTGNLVYSAGPTFTGTIAGSALSLSGNIAITNAATDGALVILGNPGAVVRVGTAGEHNFVAGRFNGTNRYSITPSTAVDGVTFSNPLLDLNASNGNSSLGNATIGGTVTIPVALSAQGISTFSSNTASTSTSTGSIVISSSGGLGVGGNVFIGGNANIVGSFEVNATSSILLANEKARIKSTLTSGMAAQSIGALSVTTENAVDQAFTNSTLVINSFYQRTVTDNFTDTGANGAFYSQATITPSSTKTLTNTNTVGYAGYTAGGMFNGGAGTLAYTGVAGFYVPAATVATGTNKYGLYVGSLSGASNNYAIYTNNGLVRLGGVTSLVDTTESTSTTTGALVVSGGAATAKNLVTGGQAVSPLDTESGSGTTHTINWNEGNATVLDLGDFSGNLTLSYSNPISGAFYSIKIIQSSTARTITWPAGTIWPNNGTDCVLSTGNDEIDFVTMMYDGSNYITSCQTDFAS